MKRQLRLSWSAIQSFLSCQRKYDLTYNENLQRKPSAEHRNLVLGSSFHAGLEAALQYTFEVDSEQMAGTETHMITRAIKAARQYIEQSTVLNKEVKDWENGGQLTRDNDYYNMLGDVTGIVAELLRFHIPLIGLGSRYTVPTIADVLSGEPPVYREPLLPAIEWHFEYSVDADTLLTGYIDSIVWDNDNEEYVMIDWKTRGSFPDDRMAMIDGQLHLYAAVVNQLAYNNSGATPINKVVMYQMKTKTPSPASIHAKTGVPNTGAASYDTTWEYWVATLPKGIKAERYWEVMQHKVKQPTDFQRQIDAAVTDISSSLALDNIYAAVDSIRAALDSGKPLAAILSSDKCKWCDFVMLCGNVLRYGGEVNSLLNEFYQHRDATAIDEIMTVED